MLKRNYAVNYSYNGTSISGRQWEQKQKKQIQSAPCTVLVVHFSAVLWIRNETYTLYSIKKKNLPSAIFYFTLHYNAISLESSGLKIWNKTQIYRGFSFLARSGFGTIIPDPGKPKKFRIRPVPDPQHCLHWIIFRPTRDTRVWLLTLTWTLSTSGASTLSIIKWPKWRSTLERKGVYNF